MSHDRPSSPDTHGNWREVFEPLALLGVTLTLALTLRWPAAWLLVPLTWLLVRRRDLDLYGLHLRGLGSVPFHLSLFAGVFLPYLVLHYLYGRAWQGRIFVLSLPPGFPLLAVEQILGIGLAEEFFFRAYLQTHLDRAFPPRWQLLGARVGPGWLASAMIFAFCHIFHGGPARLATFFPGLWYGWLWARTGNVFVPAFYHGMSNVLMAVMLSSLQHP